MSKHFISLESNSERTKAPVNNKTCVKYPRRRRSRGQKYAIYPPIERQSSRQYTPRNSFFTKVYRIIVDDNVCRAKALQRKSNFSEKSKILACLIAIGLLLIYFYPLFRLILPFFLVFGGAGATMQKWSILLTIPK